MTKKISDEEVSDLESMMEFIDEGKQTMLCNRRDMEIIKILFDHYRESEWRDMDTAPKDGTKILLMWETPADDYYDLQFRQGYWEDFSYLEESRRSKIKPCWQYISDRNSVMSIRNPTGWQPLPEKE